MQQHWRSCPPELLLFLRPGVGAWRGLTRRRGYIWLFIEKSLGTHPHCYLGDAAWRVSGSHIVLTCTWYCLVSEPFSTAFPSLLVQHCIYLPALLVRHLAACHWRCVCVCAAHLLQCCGEVPGRGADTWEKIHLDGAGGTNALMLLPVHKSAWLCFQGMHCVYKCAVSRLAQTAAILPLQPSCPSQRWM